MQLKKVSNYFFGPLDKKWCDYFFYMSVLVFLALTSIVFTMVFNMVSKKKVPSFEMLSVLLTPFLAYFQFRLFYSMCVKM